MEKEFDAVIVGSGPAGLQTAIYLARGKHSTLVIGSPKASGLSMAHVVENYFGIRTITGKEIMAAGMEQATTFGATLLDEEIVSLKRVADAPSKETLNFEITTSNGTAVKAKTIIIASGSKKASAGLPNEKTFVGKGLGYCAACDAYFFAGKEVAVIGSRDYAVHEALELAPHASKVTIFTQGSDPKMTEHSLALLKENNIAIRKDKIIELIGSPFINSIKVKQADGSETVEPIGGVFVAVGTASSADLAALLGAHAKGNYVEINRDGKTNVAGVFAAGDCTGGRLQLATSVGQGANAAFAAMEFLRGSAPTVDWA
ncbi:hypothetical protein AUJ14_03675 [Candidatus Micrarchaeota archaeon CG1_02_55_22]|nr:MAG: hypothetical protein AUJ14_03675 [Candidatus Micrarchaeota archaeon CG1_02_55_22]